MMKEKLMKVLQNWEIQPNQMTQIYSSAWDIDDTYVMKVYQNQDQLLKNADIMTALRDCDIPVAEAIYTSAGDKYAEYEGDFFLLTKKLQGKNEIDIRDEVLEEQMGYAIARLHKAFLHCESVVEFGDNSLLTEMEGWILENLEADQWETIHKEEYIETVNKLRKMNDDLPRQLIHRDVHFENFLFLDGEFSGYIDFDLSQKNIRVFDIGYFLAGLLVEEVEPALTKEEWLGLVSTVIKGYESENKLTPQEKEALPCVMECIEILFAAYFIGQKEKQFAESARDTFRFIRDLEDELNFRLIS